MNYFLRKAGTHDFSGPLTLAEIREELHAQQAGLQWEVIEAAGQNHRALVSATGWIPIQEVLGDGNPPVGVALPSAPEPKARRSVLARCAIWSGIVTVGIPALWALLTGTLGGNASLAVGWFGVLPVIILLPVGTLITLGLAVAAAFKTDSGKDVAKASPTGRNSSETSDSQKR